MASYVVKNALAEERKEEKGERTECQQGVLHGREGRICGEAG